MAFPVDKQAAHLSGGNLPDVYKSARETNSYKNNESSVSHNWDNPNDGTENSPTRLTFFHLKKEKVN